MVLFSLLCPALEEWPELLTQREDAEAQMGAKASKQSKQL